MERQHGGRVSVSVFPTFQSDVEIAKLENGPENGGAGGGEGISIGLGGRNGLGNGNAVQQLGAEKNHDVRMVMKHHNGNGNYEGAPPQHQYPQSVSAFTQPDEMGYLDKPSVKKIFITFGSEFIATYILLFLGCSGCVNISGAPPHLQISFTFGLAVLISVQCFAHVSGAHINTIVTVASVILGYTPVPLAPVYIVGQLLGAIAGYGSVMLVTPTNLLNNGIENGVKQIGVCSPALNSQLSPVQGLAVEFIASSMLVLVCCAVWDRKNSDKHDSVSVRFGLTIAVLAMAAGPYTGANMNPARSFAPALLNGDWANHWIYWVGPLLAGVVPTLVYKYLFNTPPPEEQLPEQIPLR